MLGVGYLADRQAGRQTGRWADRQAGRQPGWQAAIWLAGKQAGRQARRQLAHMPNVSVGGCPTQSSVSVMSLHTLSLQPCAGAR